MNKKESFDKLAHEFMARLDPNSIREKGVAKVFAPVFDLDALPEQAGEQEWRRVQPDDIPTDVSRGAFFRPNRVFCLMVWDVSQISVTQLKKEVGEGLPDWWSDGETWHKVEDGDIPDEHQGIGYSNPMSYLHRELFEQEQRGGRPEGKSETTRERYLVLARDYWETTDDYAQREDEKMITMPEFVEDRREKYAKWWKKLSVSTLERALKEFPTLRSTLEEPL